MNTTEIAGFIFGIAGVWLTIKENPWCFPVGLLNVIISLFLFLNQHLYSDVIQQVAYIFLLSYGWYMWLFVKNKIVLPVTTSGNYLKLILILIAIIITWSLGYYFDKYTDADVPYFDAAATALSFVAQYLVARKKIENWNVWLLVNLLYIGIYLYKGLYLYAILFLVYFIMAIYGLREWKKSLVVNESN